MADARGTVLVTGATGFVGRHVAARLLEAGWRVRGLTRGGGRLPPGVEPAPAAGLDDAAGLARAVEGVDAVVHLAARVHVMRDRAAHPLAEFRRVNVEGTRGLLQAAAAADARAFVFASSVKAVGEHSHAPWTEATPPVPADPNGVSKLEAEAVVAGSAAAAGMDAAVLRFPLVYGPGVRANMLRLFDLVARGWPVPLGGVDNRRSLLYVGNAAAAVEAVLAAPGRARGTFFVCDGPAPSTPALVRAIGRALGREPRLLPLPQRMLRLAARAGDVLARAVPFPLTTPAVNRLLGSLEVDASLLTQRTGFTPPYSLDQGLAETARWYLARDGAV